MTARRVSPSKRRILKKEGKEEQGSKGKEVKPHLPIQGHEKLHEKKEDEKFNTNGRELKRK
jgi:hypothetical protein